MSRSESLGELSVLPDELVEAIVFPPAPALALPALRLRQLNAWWCQFVQKHQKCLIITKLEQGLELATRFPALSSLSYRPLTDIRTDEELDAAMQAGEFDPQKQDETYLRVLGRLGQLSRSAPRLRSLWLDFNRDFSAYEYESDADSSRREALYKALSSFENLTQFAYSRTPLLEPLCDALSSNQRLKIVYLWVTPPVLDADLSPSAFTKRLAHACPGLEATLFKFSYSRYPTVLTRKTQSDGGWETEEKKGAIGDFPERVWQWHFAHKDQD